MGTVYVMSRDMKDVWDEVQRDAPAGLDALHEPYTGDGLSSLWPYGFKLTSELGEVRGWIEGDMLCFWGSNTERAKLLLIRLRSLYGAKVIEFF